MAFGVRKSSSISGPAAERASFTTARVRCHELRSEPHSAAGNRPRLGWLDQAVMPVTSGLPRLSTSARDDLVAGQNEAANLGDGLFELDEMAFIGSVGCEKDECHPDHALSGRGR